MKKMLLSVLISIIFFSCPTLIANASELSELDSNPLPTSTEIIAASITEDVEIVDTSNHIYSFEEMETDIAKFQELYSDRLTCFPIGNTVDNRRIWEIIIGNPDAPKAIYVQASIHGREWMNSWLVMKQIENICKNYNEELYSKVCICLVPMVNPDGVTISQYGIEGIFSPELKQKLYQMPGAKNPSLWKANANGVDLNRNFSIGWGAVKNVYCPSSALYNGTNAFSEPETLAVVAAFTSRKFEAAITYHSMEGAIYWNIGQSGELYEKTQFLAAYASAITGYRLGAKSKIHGLDYNWMIFDQQTPAILIETGTVKCPLPYSQWNEIWTRNKNLLSQLALIYN